MTSLVCAPIDRLCITATGTDAASYLHSQLSNDIASLLPGASCPSFVLDPTGKIVSLVRVTRVDDATFLMDTDVLEGLADVLVARLNRFKIRVDVTFEVDVRQGVAVRAMDSDTISPSLRREVAGLPGVVVVDAWWSDGRAVDVVPIASGVQLDPTLVTDRVSATYVTDNSSDALEIERLRAGWPAMGREIVPGETLVAATGLASRAVSFSKGCYPGQELVERMDSRGANAPRTLRRVPRRDLPGVTRDGIAVGNTLVIDDVPVGVVTSVAGEWALAYVNRGVDLGDVISPAD